MGFRVRLGCLGWIAVFACILANRAEAGSLTAGFTTGFGVHELHVEGEGRYGNTWNPTGATSWEVGMWIDAPNASGITGGYLYCENWFGNTTENTFGSSIARGKLRGLDVGLALLMAGNPNVRFLAGTGFEYCGASLEPAHGEDYTPGLYFEAGFFLHKSFFYARPILHLGFPDDLFTGQKQVLRYGLLVGFSIGDG